MSLQPVPCYTFVQVIVNNEEVNQLQEATGVSYEEATSAYMVIEISDSKILIIIRAEHRCVMVWPVGTGHNF